MAHNTTDQHIHGFFQVFIDDSAAQMFAAQFNLKDVGGVLAITSRVNRAMSDKLFEHFLDCWFPAQRDRSRIAKPVLRIPPHYARHPSRSDSRQQLTFGTFDWRPQSIAHLNKREDGSVSGALIYAMRTGWFLVSRMMVQVINDTDIAMMLSVGLSVAIDPGVMVIDTQPLSPALGILMPMCVDSVATLRLCVRNVRVFAPKRRREPYRLHIDSRDPITVSRAITDINLRLACFVSNIAAAKVARGFIVRFPKCRAIVLSCFASYGINCQPESIQVPFGCSTAQLWEKNQPLVIAWPPLSV